MSLIEKIFGKRKNTAQIARERLQIILAHERSGQGSAPDYLPALQRELMEVISKYVKVNQDDIKVQLERLDNLDVLEVNIVLPEHNR
jgi:cell division topological specificity factor